MPKTLGKGELLVDAQRAAKGHSRKRFNQLLPKKEEDKQTATIWWLNAQLVDLQQVLVANNLISPITKVKEGPFKVWSTQCEDMPRGGPKRNQVAPNSNEAESQSYNRIRVLSKWRVPLGWVPFDVDFFETLNAKRSQDKGDLQAKLRARTTLVVKGKFPTKSHTRIAKFELPP